ncbi:MAG: hypothetical protein IJL85_04795 [Erysipelotrichaceae bacterium]|nr:hypothetical protein [Erysipelotrichaceae bacterium]
MKKIIIILMTLLLCSCSNSLKWENVQDKYMEMEETVENIAEKADEFTRKDYESLLNEIEEDVDVLQAGVAKDDTETVDRLYETAVKLEKIAGLFSTDGSAQLELLAESVKELVVLAYNKTDGFEDLRNGVKEKLNGIRSWSDDMWAPIEKRMLVKWEDVMESYDEFAKDVIKNMTKKKEVTEDQLVAMKNYIVDHYDEIRYGITEDKQEVAQELYAAALQLQEYTNKMKGDAGPKVNAFATHAIEYIQNAFGVPIEDETYDFLNEAESARKWTLSLWNEVVARLQREDLYDHTR